MKVTAKKLLSLLLAILLTFASIALAEDELVISNEIDTPVLELEGEPIWDDSLDMPELDLSLDILNQSIVEQDAQPSEDIVICKPSEEAEEAQMSNASKVTIGVKEKFTPNTSKLKGKKTYRSSNTKVATVTNKGVITGKKPGTAKITIRNANGKQLVVTVVVRKAPAKVTMSKTKATLNVGATLKLKAKLPSKTASRKLTWSSSNKRVATVSSTGKVTAVAAGTAKITVKTFNGKKATCKITVKRVNPLKVNPNNVSLSVGGEATVTLTYTLNNSLKYTIGDESIVSLSWNGSWYGDDAYLTLKGLGVGSTSITFKDDYGNSATVNVTVKGSAPTPGNVLSVNPTSVSLNVGGETTVTLTYTENNSLKYSIGDESIVSLSWDGSWHGDDAYLTLKGLSAGSTSISFKDDYGNSATVNVTVKGSQQRSTFDLYDIYLETLSYANSVLPDKLRNGNSANIYINDYLGVQVDSSNIITYAMLFDGGNDRYTVRGVYPGMSSSTATSTLKTYGWNYIGTSEGTAFYTHNTLTTSAVALEIASNKVSSAAIFYVDSSNVRSNKANADTMIKALKKQLSKFRGHF